jgi:hypothetical protein
VISMIRTRLHYFRLLVMKKDDVRSYFLKYWCSRCSHKTKHSTTMNRHRDTAGQRMNMNEFTEKTSNRRQRRFSAPSIPKTGQTMMDMINEWWDLCELRESKCLEIEELQNSHAFLSRTHPRIDTNAIDKGLEVSLRNIDEELKMIALRLHTLTVQKKRKVTTKAAQI